jgi:16S rRNA (adenine1518-N6/adenine1519-N6)-dimethyltransferase
MSAPALPPLNVPALLRQHNLRPSKGLGQNYLVDEASLQKITAAAGLGPSDTVLEIGPGLGSLTRHLARAAGRVIAVELDRKLIPVLENVLAGFKNVELIQGDILELDLHTAIRVDGYRVVANLPYYITSAVIRRLLEHGPRPACLVLTVQREVAERICAGPGEMSLLALSVQLYGRPGIAGHIPAGAFYPPPKVDSAILKIDMHPEALLPAGRIERFFQYAKAGFSQKRKTLRNSLAGGLRIPAEKASRLLTEAGIDPQRRAETLSLQEWGRLVEQEDRAG